MKNRRSILPGFRQVLLGMAILLCTTHTWADETWQLVGIEKYRAKGEGMKHKDSTPNSHNLILKDDGTFQTEVIQNGTWRREGKRLILNVPYADIVRILEASFESPIEVESVQRFELRAGINDKKQLMKAKMTVQAFVSFPQDGVTHINVKGCGKYAGRPR